MPLSNTTFYCAPKNSDLMHYGVKGMKWGVRKDKPLSESGRMLSKSYQKKYGISKAEADDAVRERNRKIKKAILIGAGVTGVAVGAVLLAKYGREYADDIMRAGQTLQTVHMDKDIINSGKFYTTTHKLDKIKYEGMFGSGKDLFGRVQYKSRITAEVGSNIKVAGNKNAKKIYNDLLKNNNEFRKLVPSDYTVFNTDGLLGDGRGYGGPRAQKIFFDELKKHGYGAVADINDRKFSGFNTHANIVFDTSNIKNIKVSSITAKDVNKRGLQATGLVLLDAGMHPASLASAGFIGTSYGVGKVAEKYDNDMRKKYRKGKKR